MRRTDRSRLPEVGPDPAFAFPLILRHTLGNGLCVRTVEHDTVPVVTFIMQIEGGAGALSAIDVSEALARIGATYDACFASYVMKY